MKPVLINDPFLFGEWFGIFWFHSCYTTGLALTLKERLGYGLSQVVVENEGDVQRFFMSRSEWNTIGERYLNEVVFDSSKLETVLADIRTAANHLIDWSKKYSNLDTSSYSSDQLADILTEFHQLHHTVWTLGQIPNVLELENSFLTDYLKDWLKQKISTEAEVESAFRMLVTPSELSAAQKEEREMLRFVADGANDEQLTQHWQSYNWLQYGWTGPSLVREYFVGVYDGLVKEGKVPEQLAEVLKKDEDLLTQKKKWQESLLVDPKIRQLFHLLEELLFIKAHRMDALFMSYAAIEPILRKVAQQNYLSLSQIYGVYSGVLPDLVRNASFDAVAINKAIQYSACFYDGDSIHWLTGDKARAIVKTVTDKMPKPEAVTELTGQCAFPGIVRGTVKVVNRASEMSKFSPGDILVSNVTDPSLLPIMKQATAFVTNMGGLTCHAAIVARELQIPCVVGTKIATRIFLDGDQIEVDAEKGIVKKLS